MQDFKYACESAAPCGLVEIWVKRRGEDRYTLRRSFLNLITNGGKAGLAALQIGTGTAPTHVGIGTGLTAASVTDTTLVTEVLRSVATRVIETSVTLNDTASYTVDIAIATNYDITEAGLFNADAGGAMYSRQVFTYVRVVSGDYFRVVWKFIN